MIAMAIIIAVLDGLLFLAERLAAHQRHLGQLRLKDSVLIGLAQALAIFPGVSNDDNLQLTHRRCNRWKSSLSVYEQAKKTGKNMIQCL
jgi:hypothetical protein